MVTESIGRAEPGDANILTIFATPKPFEGHIDVIQRNAIRSWQHLHPDVEIILVGDDQGTAEVCQELGVKHIKHVRRNEYGTKYLASVYYQAQEIARHGILCHVNCDIVLMSDFWRAVQLVSNLRDRFLVAGRRWDVEVDRAVDFEDPNWEAGLRRLAFDTNRQRPPQWIDYFVFPKGLYSRGIPAFVIGRPGWDNWLLWYALSVGAPIVDASGAVVAVHQNHDYSYHPDGEEGVWHGEEAQTNYKLHENQYETLESASHILHDGRLRRNRKRLLAKGARHLVAFIYSLWFGLLDVTRPIRRTLGLRSTRSLGRRAKRRFWQKLLVIGGLAALILWWAWSVFSRGDVPAGRGY